ncbi:MAG: VanZ family protein [Pseudopelagicola sp.]|nr:VanZ family protein [Pseudopelagicola sp.]
MLIAYLTLTDAPNGPGGLPHLDKLYHLIAFFCLVLPCALFHQRSLIWLIPSAISLAGLIEIIQPYVGREGDWLDFFADIVGVGLGFLLGHTLRRSKS